MGADDLKASFMKHVESTEKSRPYLNGSSSENGFLVLEIDKVKRNPNQPRKIFNEDSLKELGASIEKYGQRQAIEVELDENGDYIIVSGERRHRAIDLHTNLNTIKATLCKEEEVSEKATISLIENIQREGLNVVEEALFLIRLKELNNIKKDGELEEIVKKDASWISKRIKISTLDEEILEDVLNNNIKVGVSILYNIAREKSSAKRIELWEKWKNKEINRNEMQEKNSKKPKIDKLTKNLNNLYKTFNIQTHDQSGFESEFKTLLTKYGGII